MSETINQNPAIQFKSGKSAVSLFDTEFNDNGQLVFKNPIEPGTIYILEDGTIALDIVSGNINEQTNLKQRVTVADSQVVTSRLKKHDEKESLPFKIKADEWTTITNLMAFEKDYYNDYYLHFSTDTNDNYGNLIANTYILQLHIGYIFSNEHNISQSQANYYYSGIVTIPRYNPNFKYNNNEHFLEPQEIALQPWGYSSDSSGAEFKQVQFFARTLSTENELQLQLIANYDCEIKDVWIKLRKLI